MTALLVDANVLCLLIAGRFVPSAVGKHKRLKAFSMEDFHKVIEIADSFSSTVTCPNILTEVSNLLSNTNDREKSALLQGLKEFTEAIEEVYVVSSKCMSHPSYEQLGLTDAAILTASSRKAAILSVDLGLVLAATALGLQAINYNWYRDTDISSSDFSA